MKHGNLLVTMPGQKDQEGSINVIGETGTVKIGGPAMNTIEQWDFAAPDPDMNAKARDADYLTNSVYGFGHQAFYRQIVEHLQTDSSSSHSGTDGLDSLALLLEITG